MDCKAGKSGLQAHETNCKKMVTMSKFSGARICAGKVGTIFYNLD